MATSSLVPRPHGPQELSRLADATSIRVGGRDSDCKLCRSTKLLSVGDATDNKRVHEVSL